ncbi:unknown [Firmicutes bacterium CAG:582]|nr:unknown [Firmicutes bacterium CAG:582]
MMKKLIIFIICLFSFPTFCFAENKKVEFFVKFADDVNSASIENIYVYYTDKSENEYSVTLKKENNYAYSYSLYDGSDITRVKVTFDQNDVDGESSILKTNDGYNIYIDIVSKGNSQIIIQNDDKTTTTTTQVISTQATTTAALGTTQNNETKTTVTTSSKIYQETKQNKVIRSIYIIIAAILCFFAAIFVIVGIIKIVNANK